MTTTLKGLSTRETQKIKNYLSNLVVKPDGNGWITGLPSIHGTFMSIYRSNCGSLFLHTFYNDTQNL
jgi:hypothetical protein